MKTGMKIKFPLICAMMAVSFVVSCSTAPETETTARPDEAGKSQPDTSERTESKTLESKNLRAFSGENTSQGADNSPVPEKPLSRPLPDNSEMQTGMGSNGLPYEIRVFRGHPELAKLERVWLSAEERKFKVFLKNGRTIEVPETKIERFQIATPTEILMAAGVAKFPSAGESEDTKSAKKDVSDEEKAKEMQ